MRLVSAGDLMSCCNLQPLVENEGAVNLLRSFSLELFAVLLETELALEQVNMLIAFACWKCEATSFNVRMETRPALARLHSSHA